MTRHRLVAVLSILGTTFLWWARQDSLQIASYVGIDLVEGDDTIAGYFPIQIDETNTLCHPENSLDGTWLPVASHHEEWCRSHPSHGSTLTAASRQLQSPNQGTVRALVLLLQFPEHGNRTLPSRDYFDSLCNVNISDYFSRQSYGQYDVTCDVMPWATLPYSQEFYANAYSNLVGREYASDFFLPQLDAIPDLSIYDANNDGAIDVVVALHSGYAAEYRRGQTCGAPEVRHRFHSQGHPDSPVDTYVRNDTRLAGYAISSVFDFVCTDEPAGIGVIAHEWLHVLRGLPDLYDPSTGRIGGIAAFGIMGAVKGPIFGEGPSSMTAFSRIRAGWMEATEIKSSGRYTVLPLNANPQAYIIRQGFAEQEYLLIENRPAVDDDKDLFGGGLLVFHVDDSKRVQGITDWPLMEDHYKVAVIQADGRNDLEQGNNNGDEDDFWKPGNVLESPATDSHFNGTTGITMEVISYEENGDIVIEISGLLGPEIPPALVPSAVPTMIFDPTALPMSVPTMIPPTTGQPVTSTSGVPSAAPTSLRIAATASSAYPTVSNTTIPSSAPPVSQTPSRTAGFVDVPWVEITAPSQPPSQEAAVETEEAPPSTMPSSRSSRTMIDPLMMSLVAPIIWLTSQCW